VKTRLRVLKTEHYQERTHRESKLLERARERDHRVYAQDSVAN
jgi:hypothetical protein